jgi:VWFA-related protein
MKKLCALLLLVAPAILAADQPAIPRAGETIEVSIVNLDVIVTDKHGQRIHGLTKDDFEVFEDGKPQAITNFAGYTTTPAATIVDSKTGVSLPATAPKRQRRTIAIFIESFRLTPNKVNPIFESLKKTLHDVVAPGDAVLIATWNLRTVVRLDYTDDLSAIDKTLATIAKESSGGVFDPLTTYRAQIEDLKDWFTESASAAAAHNLPVDQGALDWAINAEAQDAALTERVHMREKAQAINSLVSTMANEDGRKALIMVSRRFSHIAGGEYFFVGGRSGLAGMLEQQRNTTYDIRDMIKNTANAHNVTIYALYPPGLEYSNASNAALRQIPANYASGLEHQVLLNELGALKDLTDSTGGTTSWGTVNIVDELPRLRDDFEDYYSLAYRVSSRNDNRARRVVVKTKNPAYVVRTRKEYMEKDDDGRVRDQVIASLFRDPAPGGIEVKASIGEAVEKEKHHFTLPVSVRMPVSAFMTSQDGNATKGAFTVYIATGRYVGETSEITKHTIPFTVADVQKAKDGYFTYDFTLLSDFATNRLAIGVYDEVSHDSGFARVNLY